MKKTTQKLELNGETIRTLDVRKLVAVAGGFPPEESTIATKANALVPTR
jgi:hypothetical protein